jgi:RimJ/RimL family protein N-acetyltransferase
VTENLERDNPQFVALDNGRVVGFCDIIPDLRPGFTHSGSVGMGILRVWRGRGLGRALLEIYASNTAAIALYRKLGFVQEDLKRRARCLDGRSDDLLVMALLREPA